MVQARNAADALIYSVEKSLSQLGQGLDSQSRSQAEAAIAELKQVMPGQDAERIRQLSEQLSHMANTMAQAASGPKAPGGDAAQSPGQSRSHEDDDIVDADFEEVA